jgi:hypothetical protein
MLFENMEGKPCRRNSAHPPTWRERAEEARATAGDLSETGARRAMLMVADNYEKIAKRAEAKGTGFTSPPSKGQ